MAYPITAIPQCFVQIHGFEGGQYFIQGQGIISCTVRKNIREDAGTFTIVLPPSSRLSDPFQTANHNETWTDVITPMSLALIGMTRGPNSAIVMVGVVTSIEEEQSWDNDHGVHRQIVISGQDMAYFFNCDNWAALSLQFPTVFGALPGLLTATTALADTPAAVATKWFTTVMAGDNGVNAQTIFPFGGGFGIGDITDAQQFVSFTDAMAYWFEEYPAISGGDAPSVLPFGDYFFSSDGTWSSKFRRLLPFPVYEYFVGTFPTGFLQENGEAEGLFPEAQGGYGFTIQQMGAAQIKSTPMVIARINPVPRLPVDGTTFGQVDLDRWTALPLNTPDTGFIRSHAYFSVDECYNFYINNPSGIQSMFGQTNQNYTPSILLYHTAAWADAASRNRYGFRPYSFNNEWIWDGTGIFAIQNGGNADIEGLIGDIMGRVISYFHPTPLMLRATVTYPLRPDIFPTTRFSYSPFKNQTPYDFYVEGVEHNFKFGGPTTTTLSLARGLPDDVYEDNELLYFIITGDAQRKDGAYIPGVPPSTGLPLFAFFMGSPSMDEFIAKLTKAQNIPQNNTGEN